jgi:hypothetical protein
MTIEPWTGLVDEYQGFPEGQTEEQYNDGVRRRTRFVCKERITGHSTFDDGETMAIENGTEAYYAGWPGFYWECGEGR